MTRVRLSPAARGSDHLVNGASLPLHVYKVMQHSIVTIITLNRQFTVKAIIVDIFLCIIGIVDIIPIYNVGLGTTLPNLGIVDTPFVAQLCSVYCPAIVHNYKI